MGADDDDGRGEADPQRPVLTMAIDTSALGLAWDREGGRAVPLAPKQHEPPPTEATSTRSPDAIREDAIASLKRCHDPEIPLNLWDLGLIYDLDTKVAGYVSVAMTLTSPACPAIGTLPAEVKSRLSCIEGVTRVDVELTWDPPWERSRISEAGRLQLNV